MNSIVWDLSNEYGTILFSNMPSSSKMRCKNIHEINYMNEVWWNGWNWTLRIKVFKKDEITYVDEIDDANESYMWMNLFPWNVSY